MPHNVETEVTSRVAGDTIQSLRAIGRSSTGLQSQTGICDITVIDVVAPVEDEGSDQEESGYADQDHVDRARRGACNRVRCLRRMDRARR
jgi:hypothetical protein